MKKALFLLFLASVAYGAGEPAIEIKLDIDEQDTEFTVPCHQGDTPLVRAYLYQAGNRWFPSTNWGGQFNYGTDYEDSTSLVQITSTAITVSTNNYIDFHFFVYPL